MATDVSIDASVRPIQVGGHVVDSVLIFGDNDGKVSVLDTFGRQLCSGTLPRMPGNEVSIQRKKDYDASS
jgi:hypothetical protein